MREPTVKLHLMTMNLHREDHQTWVLSQILIDELEQSSTLPLRVLVFPTIRLLGFLTMCKRGSVDRTFKVITLQLFILMVEYRGVHLPVAFGWLPDKSAVSYYDVFLLLVLNTFNDNASAIFEIYGQTKLKLWQIKCNFEVDIHLGFEMLRLSTGCFFHYTQVNISLNI